MASELVKVKIEMSVDDAERILSIIDDLAHDLQGARVRCEQCGQIVTLGCTVRCERCNKRVAETCVVPGGEDDHLCLDCSKDVGEAE